MKHAILALVFAFSMVSAPVVEAQSTKSDNIVVAQSSTGFDRWKRSFRRRALSAGISARVFDTAFTGVSVNQQVLKLDGKQSEFTKTLWEYLDSAVSPQRVRTGRTKARELAQTLAAIEKTYGVDAKTVMAIWGVETNFGSFFGGLNVIEALATLAYDGRRRNWAERELIKALSIIQSGDITASQMKGSWAGAMGHTQFMPSSYIAYAQDFTRDGKRDIWSTDPTDGLASAANYLRVHGWRRGHPWGLEVKLPANFDFSGATRSANKPVSEWNRRGVRLLDGQPIPNYGNSGLWIPAGASGPAFVLFHNFNVIKRYNNASSYALAVGHLGDRIFGGSAITGKWPRGDRALVRNEVRQLQAKLTAAGFDTNGVDGVIGPNTTRAVRNFQRSLGLTPDGYITVQLLRRLN